MDSYPSGGSGSGSGLGSVLVLAGLGALIFRPKDLPIFARGAGRVLGSGVRAVRRARAAALEVAADSESSGTRTRLATAIRSVDTIGTTLRREIGGVGFSPRAYAARALREEQSKRDRPGGKEGKGGASTGARGDMGGKGLDSAMKITRHGSAGVDGGERNSGMVRTAPVARVDGAGETGADVVASLLQEAAFAAQHARIVGGGGVEGKETGDVRISEGDESVAPPRPR